MGPTFSDFLYSRQCIRYLGKYWLTFICSEHMTSFYYIIEFAPLRALLISTILNKKNFKGPYFLPLSLSLSPCPQLSRLERTNTT